MSTIKSEEISKSISTLSNNIRAENLSYESFINLYAGTENISNINNINDTVIYGRRGSGKTHLLKALKEQISFDFTSNRNFPIYIDLRKIIPLASSYEDSKEAEAILIFKYIIQNLSLALAENLHYLFEINEFNKSEEQLLRSKQIQFKSLFEEIYLEFDGKKLVRPNETLNVSEEEVQSLNGCLKLSKNPSLEASANKAKKVVTELKKETHISILDISTKIENLLNELNLERITILLDEWSEIKIGTQLHLAELIKKSFSAINLTTKIAAIPNRTNLGIKTEEKYIGLEDGGDIQAYPLDMRYVFEVNKSQTRDFFNDLLYKHLTAIDANSVEYLLNENKSDKSGLINIFFANVALNEILIASAGIPRDFINLFIKSYDNFYISQKAKSKRISVFNLRTAHFSWYETDKKEQIQKHHIENQLLQGIVAEVIQKKKSIHFLIPEKYASNKHIQNLIDFRVLHLRKNGYSHKDHPGILYSVYSVDYGCFNSQNISKITLDSSTVSELFNKSLRDIRRISLEDDFFNKFLLNIGEAFSCPHCKKPIDTNHLAYTKQSLCHHCYESVPNQKTITSN